MEAKQQARFMEWLAHVPDLQPTEEVRPQAHNAVEAYRKRRAHERALAERLGAMAPLK